MHACMYVCMCVCVCMVVWLYGCMVVWLYGWANIGNDTLLAAGTLNRYPTVVDSTLQLVHSACITFAAAQLHVRVGQH